MARIDTVGCCMMWLSVPLFVPTCPCPGSINRAFLILRIRYATYLIESAHFSGMLRTSPLRLSGISCPPEMYDVCDVRRNLENNCNALKERICFEHLQRETNAVLSDEMESARSSKFKCQEYYLFFRNWFNYLNA